MQRLQTTVAFERSKEVVEGDTPMKWDDITNSFLTVVIHFLRWLNTGSLILMDTTTPAWRRRSIGCASILGYTPSLRLNVGHTQRSAALGQQGHELGVFDRPHAMVDAVGAPAPLAHADAVCATGTLSR